MKPQVSNSYLADRVHSIENAVRGDGNGEDGLITQVARLWDRTSLLLWLVGVAAASSVANIVARILGWGK